MTDDAVGILVRIGKPAVRHLMEALSDENKKVRENSAWALGQIKDSQAVESLIETLGDEVEEVCDRASWAIASIGEPAVEQLIDAATEHKDSIVRINSASIIGQINNSAADKFLTGQLNDKNLEAIDGANFFFIQKGLQGTEDILIQALDKYGNKSMALNYLFCVNNKLEEAGDLWLDNNGWENFIFMPGSNTPIWGQ